MVDLDLCKGCMNCAFVCPGLAVTLVDYRKNKENPSVTLPYEIWRDKVEAGTKVPVTDVDGAILGYYAVERIISNQKKYPGTLLVKVKMDRGAAKEAVGIWVQEKQTEPSLLYEKELPPDDAIVCRCERITAGEIRAAIREGLRDMNQLKALTRAGMGACGSKTCRPMIWRIFQEEGVDPGEVTDRTDRPLFVEVPLGVLAGVREGV
jgi:bacterioferritin-associated ferredoxin